MTTPLEALRYHVTGAIERGEGEAIWGIPALDPFEQAGLARAARARGDWCQCGDHERVNDETSYYRRENGRHGWFHDPQLGGCGGITQTG